MRTNYVSQSYEAAKAHCSGKKKSFEAVVDQYSKEIETSSIRSIEEEILKRLRASITADDKSFTDCRIGLVEAIHDAVQSGQKRFSREYHLIYRLRDMLREDSIAYKNEGEGDWLSAIKLADDFNIIKGALPSTGLKSKSWDASCAVNSLEKKGVEFELNNGHYSITEEGKKKAQEFLQREVEKIGGEKVISYIMNHEKKDYAEEAKRFIHLPESAKSPGFIQKNSVPSNMILNLALKNLTSRKSIQGEIGEAVDFTCFEKVKDASLLISRALSCEPYSHAEYLNIPAHELSRKLLELSLYTSMHQFVQMDPRLAKRILEKTLENFGSATVDSIEIGELCRFAEKLIDMAPEASSLLKRHKNLKKLPVFGRGENLNKLIELMSISKGQVNLSYTLPGERSDYFFFPLISSLNNKLLLLPRPLAANAAVERIFSLIRKTSAAKEFSDRFGKDCLEELLREVHHETHGIPMVQGKIAGTDYEVDGIVVSDSDIHIFESKMKALVQDSRAGDDVSIIRDLIKSLLYSQSQLMDIEHELRSKGYIEVEDRKGVYRIDLSEKNVRRHSIVLHDYGVLQHKQVVFNFLASLLNYDFSHPDKKRNNDLSKLEGDINRFRNSFEKLHGIGVIEKNNPFHHSSFVNFSDIFCILNMAESDADYFCLLNSIDSVVFGMAPPVYSPIGRLRLKKKVESKASH
ncbi:hypothetical protein [Halomonas sp. SL1]|uniref:hypothetical protein n=1 Tax=Halomonas sp. SL1 TaxID=2137478 RepID=UPI0011B93EB6|nr:hypothetical protein [Halomonas sp. SL1]